MNIKGSVIKINLISVFCIARIEKKYFKNKKGKENMLKTVDNVAMVLSYTSICPRISFWYLHNKLISTFTKFVFSCNNKADLFPISFLFLPILLGILIFINYEMLHQPQAALFLVYL